jgi:hypothetical protein
MTLRLNGSTSGYTEIDAPAVAGNNNLKLPAGNGSDGNILGTDGAGNLSWVNGRMVLATAQNTTSGTNIDFTGIPSWVKRVTVIFNGVSTNGSSFLRVQIGAGTIDATGYASTNGTIGGVSVSGGTGGTAGWDMIVPSASSTTSGTAVIHLIASSTWVFNATTSIITSVNTSIAAGHKTALSGTLDRVRITTVNGTDTFDAGSINILYEG